MRSTLALSVSLAVLGLSAIVLAGYGGRVEPAAAATMVQPVSLAPAAEAEWPRVVRVPATVSAENTATLASRGGGTVTAVAVESGDHVEKGTTLAEVGVVDARGEVAQAQSRLATAKATLAQAAANDRRYHSLLGAKVASATKYGEIHRNFLAAKAEVAAATSALAAARSDLGYAVIRAPFAGTIARKDVRPGDFVAPGAPLFVLAGDTPQIRAHVGPDTYAALKVGDTADVVIDGRTIPAVMTRVVAAADPQTRTHLVELRLSASAPAVHFGSYAEVALTVGRSSVLTVPSTALVRRAGLLGVFVVDAEGRAHFRLVRAGPRRQDKVAIEAGLGKGEQVVKSPAPDLVNGARVAPGRRAEAAPAAGATRG